MKSISWIKRPYKAPPDIKDYVMRQMSFRNIEGFSTRGFTKEEFYDFFDKAYSKRFSKSKFPSKIDRQAEIYRDIEVITLHYYKFYKGKYYLNDKGKEFIRADGFRGENQRKLDAKKAKMFDWLKIVLPVLFAFGLGRCEKDPPAETVPYELYMSLMDLGIEDTEILLKDNLRLEKQVDSLSSELSKCDVMLGVYEMENRLEGH